VIVLAVRWYLRFGLSYRDVQELLAERGVEVDHLTVYRWVQRLTPLLAEAARPCSRSCCRRPGTAPIGTPTDEDPGAALTVP
jgi:transposase-like protein